MHFIDVKQDHISPFPGTREPVRWSICTAFAPIQVALPTSAWQAGQWVARCTFGNHGSQADFFDHVQIVIGTGPSVPMPTLTPTSSIRLTLAKPEANFRLDKD